MTHFGHWETAFFRNQGQCFKIGNDFRQRFKIGYTSVTSAEY